MFRKVLVANRGEALGEFEIGAIDTLIPFHRHLLRTPQWRRAETARDLVGDRRWLRATAGVVGTPR